MSKLLTPFTNITDQTDCDFDMSAIDFYDITFTHDFGPFKESESVKILNFNHEDGILSEFNETGQVVRSTKLALKPAVSCGPCKGTGKVHDPQVRCSYCKGSGVKFED